MSARNRTALCALGALLLAAWQLHAASRAGVAFGDFRAFYCAGAALAHGANPYAAAPLYACERVPMPLGLYHSVAGVTVPAPLPGYALLAFVPLAFLPYPAACAVWLAMVLAACAASVCALAALLERSREAALCALAVGFAVMVVPFGELGSVCMAGMLCAAFALRKRAWTWATVGCGVAAVTPHVALPALAAIFVLIRPMRLRVAALCAALLVLDAAAGGVHAAYSYVMLVLPAHALSEIGSSAQYGVTWMLHGLGATDRAAIAAGEASYAGMLILGLAAAWGLYARRPDSAYPALIPPAFVVFGGTFIHYAQIMIAIPAALVLLHGTRGRARWVLGAAVLLLAFPWLRALGEPALIAAYAATSALLARALLDWDAAASLRAALASTLLTGLLLAAGYHFGADLPAHVHALGAQHGLAQSSWTQFVRTRLSSTGIVWWIAKAPTWLGLAVLTLSCAYGLAKENLVAAAAVEQVPVAP